MDFDTFWQRMRHRRGASDRGLVVFRRIPSSHGVARRAAGEYQLEGNGTPSSDFLAWQQTEGQGRGGRAWDSPPGAGIYASVVRQLTADQVRALPLTVPTALASALHQVGIPCRVKWPNDLMLGDKKLGGVLIDVVTNGDSLPIAVISFGVNHAGVETFSESGITSIADQGAALTLDESAGLLLDHLDRELQRIEGIDDVLPAYRELCAHRVGDRLQCRLSDSSDEKISGRFLGIDDQGLLRLEIEGEERRLSTGRLVEP